VRHWSTGQIVLVEVIGFSHLEYDIDTSTVVISKRLECM